MILVFDEQFLSNSLDDAPLGNFPIFQRGNNSNLKVINSSNVPQPILSALWCCLGACMQVVAEAGSAGKINRELIPDGSSPRMVLGLFIHGIAYMYIICIMRIWTSNSTRKKPARI